MKKLLAMVLAAVLLLSFSGIALATQVHSIGTDLDMQSVFKTLPITVKIHPTIAMNTFEKKPGGAQKDEINIPCLNPKTNFYGEDGVDWLVWSNLPFYKTVSWTGLTTSWDTGMPGCPHIEDTIPADRVVVKVDDVPISNPWTSPIIGYPEEQHQEKENVMVQLEIDWCDSAGIYTGSLYLDAHQN
ncbi:MAG: hypothetical protein QME54_03775 [Actinomycetota bacterium]|nr:hypothetical protein [Actinomycetota bacterium]